ncbi:MAG: hypothetical protein JOZ54_01270, partial [Acidobacteria bacterium]|nr:hypothetical protein [Acidobacteriota bacterium]
MKRTLFAVVLLLLAFQTFAADGTRRYLVTSRGTAPMRESFRQLDEQVTTGARSYRNFPRVQVAAVNLTDDEAASLRAEGNIVEPLMERHL